MRIALLVVAVVDWLFLLALAVFVVLLYRQFGLLYLGSRAQAEARGPSLGARLPIGLDGLDELGREVLLDDVVQQAGGPVAFLATRELDRVGHRLFADLPRIAEAWGTEVELVVLFSSLHGSRAVRPEIEGWRVLVIPTEVLEEGLGISATPLLVVVGGDGVVRTKEIVNTAPEVSRRLAYGLDERLEPRHAHDHAHDAVQSFQRAMEAQEHV